MMDGIIFYASLLASIGFSNYYKKIDDIDFKRNFGAGLGFVIALLICKLYIVQYIILVCGNIILLKCSDKRYVHQTTLVYSWLVMLHMHLNASCSKYVIWLFQTITLKLVGMGFDRNMGEKKAEARGDGVAPEDNEDEIISIVPSPFKLLVFAFYFIGIHRGPYYRWKTYQDHLNIPFNALGDCRKITEFKLKKALGFFIAYCTIKMCYPVSNTFFLKFLLSIEVLPLSVYVCTTHSIDNILLGKVVVLIKLDAEVYRSEYFYTDFGTDYRFITNVPHMLLFFLEEQITMMLCTSVFTEAGFGLYPAKCAAVPGIGPTTQLDLLKKIKDMPDEALNQEYNFAMLSCFNNEKILMGPKMKDSMRGWIMPTRQWFWANTYKNFIRSNKEVRSACAFVLWTIWFGPTKPNIIKALTLWIHIHLEDECQLLFDTTGPMKVTWDIGYSWMRIFCLIYLVPCTVLEGSNTVIRYYKSIYWAYHFVLATMTVGAIILHKTQGVHGRTKKSSITTWPPKGNKLGEGSTRADTSTPDSKNSPSSSSAQSSHK